MSEQWYCPNCDCVTCVRRVAPEDPRILAMQQRIAALEKVKEIAQRNNVQGATLRYADWSALDDAISAADRLEAMKE